MLLAYLIHLLEEYFGGEGLPQWFSRHLPGDLSDHDFLVINGVALLIVFSIAVSVQAGLKALVPLIAVGALFFVNAWLHLLAGLFTWSYSPGLFSGILCYMPLGILMFRKIFPLCPMEKRVMGVVLGIVLHILVFFIAVNI